MVDEVAVDHVDREFRGLGFFAFTFPVGQREVLQHVTAAFPGGGDVFEFDLPFAHEPDPVGRGHLQFVEPGRQRKQFERVGPEIAQLLS